MVLPARRRGVDLRFTTRADGDVAWPDGGGVPERVGAPSCTVLRQVHGADAVLVTRPGENQGASADAAVVGTTGVAVAVRTADCAPIALVTDTAFAVVHAGWRGLLGGVVATAIAALRDIDRDAEIDAVLGPCIHAQCYEFGRRDLDAVAGRYGDGVRSVTGTGADALDLVAAVRAACHELGVPLDSSMSLCTACAVDEYGQPRFFSHRARGDLGRQALIAWRARELGPAGRCGEA